jgi:gamma-butyrobetaine dioxygenase
MSVGERVADVDAGRTIVASQTHPDRLLVTWDSGAVSTFHHLWLRDNCPCPTCRHPLIPERLVDTLSIPDDITPSTVEVGRDGTLRITWAGEEHHSVFDPSWLAEHAYDDGPKAAPDDHTLWAAATMTSPPEFGYDAVMGDDAQLLAWLRDLRRFGLAFVRDAPTTPGTVVDLAERVAFLRNSNFGLLWDVISKPDPDSLAYTAHALAPHIDLCGREMLPGVQFLHCLVFEASGGDSILVDGFACAAELAATDPASYELLTTTPLLFRYRDGGRTDISARAPLIRLDHDGRPREVRFTNALLAPLDVPPDLTLPIYRAVRAFGRLLGSDRFAVRFRLEPGDVMCFDNYRVLHGRSEFDPNSGARHLQGCYIDRDDFLSRIRTLEAATAALE